MELKQQIEEWIRLDYIVPEDIPNIELYMDQVTTFMDTYFARSKRYPEDKTLTKTMINNYTKNSLMPPPTKKKYTKNHIFLLIYIYYFKNILSINDIQKLLQPLTDKYYGNTGDKGPNFNDIYKLLFEVESTHYYTLKESVLDTFDISSAVAKDMPDEDQEFLQNFIFIALLSYDVYMKKQLIERMIDNLYTSKEDKKKKNDKS